MLERAIMERIQLQFAQGTGLRIDDAQLDQAIGRIAANNRMTPQQFKLALEKDGVRYARFREEIRDEMTMVRLREREVDSRLVISDGEVDAYLANQTASGGQEFRPQDHRGGTPGPGCRIPPERRYEGKFSVRDLG